MNEEHFSLLYKLIFESIAQIQEFVDEKDIADVQMHLEHDEYGVAWELLWHVVRSNNICVPPALIEAGKMMDFDVNLED